MGVWLKVEKRNLPKPSLATEQGGMLVKLKQPVVYITHQMIQISFAQ